MGLAFNVFRLTYIHTYVCFYVIFFVFFSEPRNRDPPPQSAMDQRQNKKKLSLSKKDNGKFYYCNSDPCLSPGTKEGNLTVAGAGFSKVLVTLRGWSHILKSKVKE